MNPESAIDNRKALINVLTGRDSADLAVVNGGVVNVYTGELLHNHSIAMKGELIAYVGDAPGDVIGPDTVIIDAGGKTVIPGLIDSHTHLADCKYSPFEFLKRSITGGTTTVITETMEPFPIAGYEGVTDFMESLMGQPIKIFFTAPAMVSISGNVKIPGKDILHRLLSREDVLGLGEAYWQGVMQRKDDFLPNFMATMDMGKRLEGHSAGARGKKLIAYVATGVTSCHEPVNAGEALERLRLGLYVMIREGSVRKDLAAVSGIMEEGIDYRRLILVTDGVNPVELLEKGYMENVVQKAIDIGIDPVKAIRMATLNPAEYFGLDRITGGIAPGRHGDMLIIPSLREIRPEYVISRGKVIAKRGKLLAPPRRHVFSHHAFNSIAVTREIRPSDFIIRINNIQGRVKVRVIDMVTDLVAREHIASVPVIDGVIKTDIESDILKVAAIDRANAPGCLFTGLVRGFRIKRGAIASSSAWDSSDIIVVGTNETDMAKAVNRICALQGGAVVCVDGRILSEIPLPIFGLMTEMPLEDLAGKFREMAGFIKGLGCPFEDTLLTLATLTGAAIPFIRICEEGLVNIKDGDNLKLFPA
ncbi:MAG: adenine deaminase [Deltaproteobacteria bacterium]|nr:adenine deaminase [Deltaproteobacteria bacterium]